MQEVLLKIIAQRASTRLEIGERRKPVLKAVLPSVTIADRHAARTLLQGLALWYQSRVCVVLCVDEQQSCSETLQLYEDIGGVEQTLYYEVVVVPREGRGAGLIRGTDGFRGLSGQKVKVGR
jgi:hypothetical protein